MAAFYDSAISKALAAAREGQAQAMSAASLQEATDRFASEGAQAYPLSAPLLQGLDAYHALLKACQQVRYDNPERMVELAALASYLAGRLSSDEYGEKGVADLRARALIELGNALRVAEKLRDAEKSLGEAAEALLLGTGDELLKARLFEIQATLYADWRRFNLSCEALDAVYAIHNSRGDSHLAGRSLLKKGIYTGYAGNAEQAIVLIKQGLSQVDSRRDPELVVGAIYNQVHFLVECGRFKEAKALFWDAYAHTKHSGGHINLLRLRWIEGRVYFGLGDLDRAAREFLFAKKGFEDAGLGYKAALTSLDLAAVWLRQGKIEEVRPLILEAVEIFLSLKIQREVLAGVLLLKKACETRTPMHELLDSVREYLRRAEHDPTVHFEAWFQV